MTSPSLTKINKLTFAGDVEPQWSVFAVGDFCDLRIRHDDTAETPRISGELQQLIQQSDLSIVNLEAPLVDSPDPLPKVGPHIHMSTDVASALARCGFDVASLANNHMMDYGSTAQGSTIAACREQGISTCGAGENQLAAFEPVRLSPQQGIQVSLVGCCEQEFGVATKDKAGVAWISDPMALRIIEQEAKLSDVVIVIAHGGVEEVPFSPIQRQAQLRQFIDAGATLVIGHHPHVPQGWETYRHGIIFHSLGNFIFDYPEGKRWPKTDWGLAIQAHFNGSTLVDVDLIPVETRKDGTVAKLGLERSLDECLQYLHELSRIIRQPDRYAALWQETAVFLWEKRYYPWFSQATGAARTVFPLPIKKAIRRFREMTGNKRSQFGSAMTDFHGLLVLDLIRNESHRWAIESALSVMHGDEGDFRSSESAEKIRKLLKWTLD